MNTTSDRVINTGEYLEERLIGMLLAQPERIADVDLRFEDYATPLGARIVEAIREHGGRLSDMAETFPGWGDDVGVYLLSLLENESFNPELLPAYVRALRETAGQRAYAASTRRLSTRNRHKLFGDV